MGQESKHTYTAPDGTVYRVGEDGILTKIKDGGSSNEAPSKYQVTPDGKIYRLESDGSVTFLGNAEDKSSTPISNDFQTEKKRKNHAWIWIIGVLVVIAVIASLAYVSMQGFYSTPEAMTEDTIACSIEDITEETGVDTCEVAVAAVVEGENPTKDNSYYNRATFSSYENRAYIYRDDNGGYFSINFYDNGQCDIFDGDNMIDSGGYVPNGNYISFDYFDNWPNTTVNLNSDDSFQFNGITFCRW